MFIKEQLNTRFNIHEPAIQVLTASPSQSLYENQYPATISHKLEIFQNSSQTIQILHLVMKNRFYRRIVRFNGKKEE